MPSAPANIVAEDIERLLARTSGSWEALRGARLFVTGGTGFFGSWLLQTLVAAEVSFDLGLRVVVLSRDPDRFASRHPGTAGSDKVRLVAGDVRDFPFPRGPFTHVIHAATEASAALERDDPRTMEEVCREGTSRVLSFAEACGAARVLFTSSGAVYARPARETTRFSEEMSTTPAPGETAGAYATGKRAAEKLCLAAASRGAGVTIARCFAFVGPRLPLDAHFAIGNFIRDAMAGGPIVVNGDGRTVRSYLYSADLVEWLGTILLRGVPGRPYNVGSDEGLPVGSLARLVADAVPEVFPGRPRPEVVVRGLASPGTAPSVYVPDCTRARTELGLRPETGLDQAIRRTMRAAAG
jgi:nucleoside-diphosphate-sugar epimerase